MRTDGADRTLSLSGETERKYPHGSHQAEKRKSVTKPKRERETKMNNETLAHSLSDNERTVTKWVTIDEICTAHRDIEKLIGELPEKKPQQGRWAMQLARILKAEDMTHLGNHFIKAAAAKNHLSDADVRSLRQAFEWAVLNLSLPLNAPEQVARTVGGITATEPTWCRKSGDIYKRLWLATLLLGANGRDFPFATSRIAAAFNLKSKNTATRFVAAAIKHGHMIIIREGMSHPTAGKATLYRLQKDQEAWKSILSEEQKYSLPWIAAAS